MQSLPSLRWADYRVGLLDVFLRSAAWQARKTSKEKNKKSSRPVECQTAYCLDCKEVRNADEFMIDEEDRFVDFKDRGNG